MAVEARKSAGITNRDASPRVKMDSATAGGRVREEVATIETVSGDSTGSTYRMLRLPSNARVSQVLLYADDIGTTTAADFGIYQTTENGGAVVDADFFASGVAMNAAATNASDITHESAVFGLEDAEKPLWEALGLSADPQRDYDLVVTLTGDADGAGTITLKCKYVD